MPKLRYTCPKGKFTCRDLSCISIVHRCDGRADCPHDRSDEEGCRTLKIRRLCSLSIYLYRFLSLSLCSSLVSLLFNIVLHMQPVCTTNGNVMTALVLPRNSSVMAISIVPRIYPMNAIAMVSVRCMCKSAKIIYLLSIREVSNAVHNTVSHFPLAFIDSFQAV